MPIIKMSEDQFQEMVDDNQGMCATCHYVEDGNFCEPDYEDDCPTEGCDGMVMGMETLLACALIEFTDEEGVDE